MNEHRRSCATNDEWRCSFFEHRAMLKSANGYSPSDISLIFETMDQKRTSSPPAKLTELLRSFLLSLMKQIKRLEAYGRNIQDLLNILKKFKAHINLSELKIHCATLYRNVDIHAKLKLNQICESAPKPLFGYLSTDNYIFQIGRCSFHENDRTNYRLINFLISIYCLVFCVTYFGFLDLDRKNCVFVDEYFGQSAKKGL